MRSALITTTLLAALIPVTATAQPAAAPAPIVDAGATRLKVHVEEVGGIVRVRGDEKAPWQRVKVGMDIDEGAEFQTGPKSFVRCSIPPDQGFTLERLGTVKVLQAIQDGKKVTTDMLMKYGRVDYSIEAAGLQHESTIASPSSTLAVRGTHTVTYDQPPFAYVVETDHLVQLRDVRRQISVGSNKSSSKVKVAAGKNGAAETSLAESITDPRYSLSRTQAENVYIAQTISRGGVLSFDPIANILVVRNSNPITNDAQFAVALPRGLDLTVRWTSNSNVNFAAFTQVGDPLSILFSTTGFQPTEYLYPGYGLDQNKNGARIPFDDRGGPRGGTELAFFPNPPKAAVFGITASLISGPATDIKFNAVLNGKPLYVFGTDPKTGQLAKAFTFDLNLNSSNAVPQTALVFLPSVPLLEQTTPNEGDVPRTPPTRAPAGRSGTVKAAPALAGRPATPQAATVSRHK